MKKFIQKAFIIFILSFIFLVTKSIFVFAVDSPNFTTCPNPNGSLIASYDSGTHGIVGDYSTHTGSDYVYKTSETTVTQCFCAENGVDGIQTNWWNAAELTQDEINGLEKDGWLLVPNGALWGLSQDPYLAKNLNFACGGGSGGGSSNGSSTATSGQVLGASTVNDPGQVLGANTSILADTNNGYLFSRVMAALLIALGIFFVLII